MDGPVMVARAALAANVSTAASHPARVDPGAWASWMLAGADPDRGLPLCDLAISRVAVRSMKRSCRKPAFVPRVVNWRHGRRAADHRPLRTDRRRSRGRDRCVLARRRSRDRRHRRRRVVAPCRGAELLAQGPAAVRTDLRAQAAERAQLVRRSAVDRRPLGLPRVERGFRVMGAAGFEPATSRV